MKKAFKIFLFTIFTTLLTASVRIDIHAAIIEKKYDRVYELNDEYVQVTETKEINITQSSYYIATGTTDGFTIFNPIGTDPEKESKIQKTRDSISLTDKNNNKLEYTVEETANGNLIIKAKINQTITNQNNFKLNLSYKSYGLIIKSGIVRDLYIPAFAQNYIFEDDSQKETITTKVTFSKNFGEVNFTRPLTNISTEGNLNVLTFKQEELVGQTAWIQIGTKQNYKFAIKQKYFASTTIPLVFNRYAMVIPRDISSGPIEQKVFYTKISPEPSSITLDDDGNLIAEFKVPAVDDGEIMIEGYATVSQNNGVDYKNSGSISDIPKSIINSNTKDAIFWEVDSADIQKTAKEIVDGEQDVYKAVESIYKYVVSKIDYSEVKKFGINQRQGALSTLKGGAAVCMEYSDLFIALVRAAGIPARAAFGSGYSSLEDSDSSSNAINHQWAEVYIPNLDSWIAVDTTWGENGDILIGGDLNHFYSHVASIDPENPATTQAVFYGQDNKLVDREMTVSAVSTLGENQMTQVDLIQKYPSSASNSDLQDGIKLLASKINIEVNGFLKNLGVPSQHYSLVKYAFVILVILILLILSFSSISNTRRKNKEIRRLKILSQTEHEQ